MTGTEREGAYFSAAVLRDEILRWVEEAKNKLRWSCRNVARLTNSPSSNARFCGGFNKPRRSLADHHQDTTTIRPLVVELNILQEIIWLRSSVVAAPTAPPTANKRYSYFYQIQYPVSEVD